MNTISEIQLSYSNVQTQKTTISNSMDTFSVLLQNWNQDTIELQEEFKILLLDRANQILGIYNMSRGGVSGTIVDVKLVMASALKSNASGIIAVHNHPSGNLKPSSQDIILTKKLKKAAEYLDILFLDHLIISKDAYYSFSDEVAL